MHPALLVPLVAQVLLPLGLVAWAGSRRHASRLGWALAVVLAGAWLVAIRLAGAWLVVPWYLPLVIVALLLAAMLRSFPSIRGRRVLPTGWHMAAQALTVLAIAAVAAIIVIALRGARVPGAAVDLEAPLRGGTYLVANGGSNPLVSAHVKTLGPEPRFQRWRGQSYGVDLVRVDAAGRCARGLLPRDPAAYFIFGDTVVAPCAGRVISSSDGLADLPVPEMDREHMAGNHVILECDGRWVLLAHLRRGSVLLAAGDSVEAGEPLGQVGNTGNTGEPHLHVHAQLPGSPDMPIGGDPVPITIGGRYLVRGARVQWRRAAARDSALASVGWDVAEDGLFGAPPVTVPTAD